MLSEDFQTPRFLSNFLKFFHQIILDGSLFLVFFKMLLKGCLLVFILIVARYLTQEDFGDFQFVMSIVNLIIQPMIIITMVVTRVGCSMPSVNQGSNLRWIYQKSRIYLAGSFIFIIVFCYAINSWLIEIGNIQYQASFTLAGLLVALYLLFYYNLGFLQTIESFHAIGLLYFLIGCITLILGFITVQWTSEVSYVYAVQIAAIAMTLMTTVLVVNYKLPKQPLPVHKYNLSIASFSFILFFSITAFFVLYNMDVIMAKILFSRTEAGYYLRMEILGKISFIFSSALAIVIFPQISKLFEHGKNPVPYLIKSSMLFFILSVFSVIVILVFAEKFFRVVFGDNFSGNMTILALMLTAKIFQAYIFLLINYEGAIIDRFMVYWMSGIMAVQTLMFWLNHDSLLQIAINILIPSVMGSAGIMITILINKNKSQYITE